MISKLHIETALQGDRTILKNCFYTPPFKVLDITEDLRQAPLHLMLMNASPGVLDGDAYFIQLNLAAGSSVQLHTQSFQRLFHMKRGASQDVEINMHECSYLHFIPHPVVPHEASHFVARNKIYLSESCTLILGEVLTCGRKGSGEQFRFSKYHSVTEIFKNGRLIVKENLLLQPSLFASLALGQLEGYTHQASLIYINEEAAIPALTDAIHEELVLQKNICFGISSLPVNGFIVRILGYKAEQLYGLLKKLANELVPVANQTASSNIQLESYAN